MLQLKIKEVYELFDFIQVFGKNHNNCDDMI